MGICCCLKVNTPHRLCGPNNSHRWTWWEPQRGNINFWGDYGTFVCGISLLKSITDCLDSKSIWKHLLITCIICLYPSKLPLKAKSSRMRKKFSVSQENETSLITHQCSTNRGRAEQSFGCSPAVGIRLGLGFGLLSPKRDYSSRNANEVNSFCRIGYWCLPCGYTEGRSLLLTSLSSTDLTELHKGENYPHFRGNNSKVRLKSWFNLRSLFHTARVHKHIISQILNVSGAENTFRTKKSAFFSKFLQSLCEKR